MYSYEDRVRAVKLYLKLGKRIRATVRQLGYPTKNSLISWHQQFERLLDLPAGYSRKRPKYSDEQKAVAVEHYRSHGCCIAFTIRALGYPCRGLLTTWVREAYPEAMKRVVGKARSAQLDLPLKQAAVIVSVVLDAVEEFPELRTVNPRLSKLHARVRPPSLVSHCIRPNLESSPQSETVKSTTVGTVQ
jgi:transposase-like protein